MAMIVSILISHSKILNGSKISFPTITQRCKELGIDICNEALPVVPAAHYTCGGVNTNIDAQS